MKISRTKTFKILSIFMIILIINIIAFNILNVDKENDIYAYEKEEIIKEEIKDIEVLKLDEVDIIETPIVYDNMTLEELSNKLERSLNSTISGYGDLIASYSLDNGIDPYLATAIMLHETGCTWECSALVKQCNNVGGMKGTGCGSYGYFNTLEEGIKKFIDNIYKNYYAYGLTNANLMGNKYAEDPDWSKKVNNHIEKIKNR